jgi:hypothetical protein
MELSIIPLFLFFRSLVGQTDINLMDIPTFLAERLGISVFAAGLLASGVVILLPIIIISILTRGKGFIMQLMVTLVFLGLDVAVGWLPVWLFAIVILLIAFGFASFMSDKIGGSGK